MFEAYRLGDGCDRANDEVNRDLQGGQDQVGGPQVPLLGHGNVIETQNWARKGQWLLPHQHSTRNNCEPWGYVALVRHIYLILAYFQSPSTEKRAKHIPHSSGGVAYCPNECISFQGYTLQMLGADGRMSKSG